MLLHVPSILVPYASQVVGVMTLVPVSWVLVLDIRSQDLCHRNRYHWMKVQLVMDLQCHLDSILEVNEKEDVGMLNCPKIY